MAPLPTILRAVAVWLVIILLETAQGALRRWLLGPDVDFAVRQFSVVTGVVVVFLAAWLFRRWLALHTGPAALAVGALWAALTMVFEVGLGRLLGLRWSVTAADYDLTHGGLMPLGLLAMALAPWVVRGPSPR